MVKFFNKYRQILRKTYRNFGEFSTKLFLSTKVGFYIFRRVLTMVTFKSEYPSMTINMTVVLSADKIRDWVKTYQISMSYYYLYTALILFPFLKVAYSSAMLILNSLTNIRTNPIIRL